MTITSKDNEKLKLVRKLQERKHREREGLFVTEGEDLLEAGLTAGFEPAFVLTREAEGLGGDEVAAELLDAASTLGSGTRVIAAWPLPISERPGVSAMARIPGRPEEREGAERPGVSDIAPGAGRSPEGALCVYLHGVGDPGNVGSIVRSAGALADASLALGPGCADPYGPRAVRASMGAIFAVPIRRCGVEETPSPRIALVAHGGEPLPRILSVVSEAERDPLADPRTLCLGSEREGLPAAVIEACDASWTIPMREGAIESLGVAAAAAIALSRIGSPTEETA